MPTQSYRLRIRNANDDDNELIISSVRSDDYPYIASIPNGDGQEVDLLTGAVRTGSYVVEVVDAVTGSDATGTLRVVTNKLYDPERPHLLSRKAFIEVSTNGGSTWPIVWQAGYISNITQIDAIRYAFTVSNTRRVEQSKQVFTWSDRAEQDAFPQRGCIIGGPVIGGFGADAAGGTIALDSGGWEFALIGTANPGWNLMGYKRAYYVGLEFLSGSVAPDYTKKSTRGLSELWSDSLTNALQKFVQYDSSLPATGSFSGTEWEGLTGREKVFAYPRLTAIISDGTNEWRGNIASMFTPRDNPEWFIPGVTSIGGDNRLFVTLYDEYVSASTGNPLTALPAINSVLRVRIVSTDVTPESPVYFDLHPADVVAKLYENADIAYLGDTDNPSTATGSLTWIKEQLGTTLRLAARITESQNMAEFLERGIFGPFGFAARVNASGIQEFFLTRRLGGTVSYTITDDDIQGDTPPAIWALDESTVVTGFTIEQKQYTQWIQPQDTKIVGPADNVVETAQPIKTDNGDTSTFSTRVVDYKIPGMVHDAASFTPSISELVSAISIEGFDRFGRGAPVAEIPVLRTSAAADAQVGDLVYIDASYYPNENYRIGEASVATRVAQVVRRDEKPEGPVFKLVDCGLASQPAVTPTISIAAATGIDPYRVAQFTITNAATLNSTTDTSVAVEWATGSATPTVGSIFTRYNDDEIPTIPVVLPSVIPGSRVWVRARSERAGRTPSPWSAWTSVTLTAWVVPTSLTATALTTGVTLAWNNNGNTTDSIQVYVAPGSVAPSDWSPYRQALVMPGTTRAKIGPLTSSTAYIAAIAFFDASTQNVGTFVTRTFTTLASTATTASRPAGLYVIPGVEDNNSLWASGIQLALFSASGEQYTVIQRAPNTTPGGVDTPGTYTELMVVPSSQVSWINYLPIDNTKYWYRTLHRTIGKNDSSATAGVMGVAQGIFGQVFSVDAVEPIVSVSTSESGTTATVTIDVTDPQNRLQQIRFRNRTNNGSWSAWTVDSTAPYSYNATIPATGFVEVEYEVTAFAGDGVSRIVAAGIESFDADTNATIVSASGTFTLAGALTLAVQGDTDTNSFKYAVATTNWASDAAAYTAAQAGTLVNARNSTITLSGPYSAGTTVYVAIAGYTGASAGGTVAGPFRYAFTNGSQDTTYSLCEVVQTNATATAITVQVNGSATTGTPQVRLVAIDGTATRTAGATPGTLVASGSSWTFSRGAFGDGPSQAEFEAVLAGTVSDTDFITLPEQGRDTVPLITRARVLGTPAATYIDVRVAVACAVAPSPNSATITYVTEGLGTVTQTSGAALPGTITVTPQTANSITETAGSFYDFRVPRPAVGSPPGRITFTVTATGRVADSDAVDIVAQDIVGPSLSVVTTPSASSYSLVVTWTGTIVYNLDGVSQSVSGWTSPRTVTITRNDYLGATQVAAFNVTKDNSTVSESVNVPPKDNSGASITIGTQTADDTTDDYEFSWTTSGFPTGTTYNLTYTTTTTAGVIEQGSLNNQTSPVTVASGFNIGASPKYQMRIDAIKSGTLILTASRSGTFLT